MRPMRDMQDPAAGKSWRFLIAVLPASCLGFSNLVLLPVWTEAVASGTGLRPETLLLVGSLELAAVGFASLGVSMFGLQKSVSGLLRAGLAIIFLANAIFSFYLWSGGHGIIAIGLIRSLAGIGEGVAASTALARLGRSPDAERMLLLNQFVIGVFAILFFSILPPMIGWAGRLGAPSMATFVLLTVIALAALPLARFADSGEELRQETETRASQALDGQALLGIGMVFCFLTGFTVIYSSWGRFAARIGMDVGQLSTSLAIGASVGLVGLGAMTLLSRHIRLFPTIGLCIMLLVLAAFTATHASLLPLALRHPLLQAVICTEQVASLILSPLLMTVLALRDPSGRMVAMAPLATMSASITGTLCSALIIRHVGPFPIGWFASLLYGCGLAFMLLLWRRSTAATAGA